mmetsp:Transcript_41724/g.97708  ORF Transcript_41724/g.97708 Transcript_41724/m.97708 type:complete len:273 (-) Transcript_41724:862-1680(-)
MLQQQKKYDNEPLLHGPHLPFRNGDLRRCDGTFHPLLAQHHAPARPRLPGPPSQSRRGPPLASRPRGIETSCRADASGATERQRRPVPPSSTRVVSGLSGTRPRHRREGVGDLLSRRPAQRRHVHTRPLRFDHAALFLPRQQIGGVETKRRRRSVRTGGVGRNFTRGLRFVPSSDTHVSTGGRRHTEGELHERRGRIRRLQRWIASAHSPQRFLATDGDGSGRDLADAAGGFGQRRRYVGAFADGGRGGATGGKDVGRGTAYLGGNFVGGIL